MQIIEKFKYAIKDFRTWLVQFFYLRRRGQARVPLSSLSLDTSRCAVCVVAFENPWVSDWQIRMFKRNCPGMDLYLFDNSRNAERAMEIQQVCENHGVYYLRLPLSRTRHPNRSHGLALNWIYRNFILQKTPSRFGFLDHDLIPLAPFDLNAFMQTKPVYGQLSGGGRSTWQLWAGYCFFETRFLTGKKVDFMYDFALGLDTGGRNYRSIYRHMVLDPSQYCSNHQVTLQLDEAPDCKVQVLDGVWLHIGGVSYNNNLQGKAELVQALREQADAGRDVLHDFYRSHRTNVANIQTESGLI